ncbi:MULTISPECIES: hypothetical protein [Sphingomonas]|jgi:hypothetical protein|uniref:Metal-dependent hydrolase n=1 Tax=Sphingomonas olei TaxID=1886787 RepID=A0ABY2QIU9_9SPHN|nr:MULTISPECIES: hypothetical protein [Sphingomonas]KKI17885.1 hypothetical protein XM50_16820 [Sphingomonas sp. Ag1]THG39787.1 hypothetical protein E5988_08920 [Sphingomonas olei]
MFIGHYAPALLAAALPHAPRLGTLFVAAQLVDLAFFALTLLNIEHLRLVPGSNAQTSLDLYHMPYTHSLLGTTAFAAFWVAGARLSHVPWHATMIGALVVLSHWPIDWLVHLPDLTLAGQPPKLGLGLWATPLVARPLELALTAAAFAWYVRRTRPAGRYATLALVTLAAAMLAAQLVDWSAAPPTRIVDPIHPALPLTALAAFTVLALLATWVGRTRRFALGPRLRTL